MMTILDIPFSYLLFWARRNKNNFRFTYLNTLSARLGDNYQGLWRDVIAQVPVTKPFKDLQASLSACEHIILRDYSEDSKVVVLPANASGYSSFYDRVKAFIVELGNELVGYKVNHIEREYRRQETYATLLRESFQYRPTQSNPVDRGVIASYLNCTRQRVDQRMTELVSMCQDILSGLKVGRVVADSVLVAEYATLKQTAGTMISKDSFRRAAGLPRYDEKTMEFLASTLGMAVMEQKKIHIPIVAAKGLLADYVQEIGNVIDGFRNAVVGIRTDFELNTLLNQIQDSDLRKAFRMLVLNSEEFVHYSFGGDDAVALRWDLLLTIPARLCWILYENNALDFNSAIYKTDLVKLYNNQAKLYGESKITLAQLPSSTNRRLAGCWRIMNLGKTGFWKLRQTKGEKFDLDRIISDYLKVNGNGASFPDFLTYIKALGIDRFYPNTRSLSSRYVAAGGVIVRKRAANPVVVRLSKDERQKRFDYILHLLKTTGKTCSVLELHTEFCKLYPGTNYATFTMWVRNLGKEKKINIVAGKGRNASYVSDLSITVTLPRTIMDDVMDKAVSIIWTSPNHQISSRDLFPQLVALLPSSMASKVQKISRALQKESRIATVGPKGRSTFCLTKIAQIQMLSRIPQPPVVVPAPPQQPVPVALNETELKKCLMNEFAKELADHNINAQKAVDNVLIIWGLDGPIPSDFSFYDTLALLPHHYHQTLTPDRERHVKSSSLSLVELFLKNFYKLKYNGDICQDIQTDWPNVRSVGLSTIVNYLGQKYNYLPVRNSAQSQYYSPEERKVGQMVTSVVNARNSQLAHPDQLMNTSLFDLEKTIHDSYFVMLYVASQY